MNVIVSRVGLMYYTSELMCEYNIIHKESKTQFNIFVMN